KPDSIPSASNQPVIDAAMVSPKETIPDIVMASNNEDDLDDGKTIAV
ncbi:hypothetical protein A2U01_0085591, partial [Trifolium medium]|nr:hypothetical protein [Trifolium medium]